MQFVEKLETLSVPVNELHGRLSMQALLPCPSCLLPAFESTVKVRVKLWSFFASSTKSPVNVTVEGADDCNVKSLLEPGMTPLPFAPFSVKEKVPWLESDVGTTCWQGVPKLQPPKKTAATGAATKIVRRVLMLVTVAECMPFGLGQ
jgi:hypothetical protein